MPVPSSINDLDPTPSSNSPAGSESVFPQLDDYLRAGFAYTAQLRDSISAPTYGGAYRIPFFNGLSQYATASTFVRDASGNVGIGTGSPGAALDVSSGASTSVYIRSTAAATAARIAIGGNNLNPLTLGVHIYQDGSGNGGLTTLSNAGFEFGTNNTTRARIGPSGGLIIGASTGVNPTQALDVRGSAALSGILYSNPSGSGTAESLRITDSGGFVSGYNSANSSRTGYIQFNAGGYITSAAENSLGFAWYHAGQSMGWSATGLAPSANNVQVCGSSSFRWSTVYAVNGDFSGNIGVNGTVTATTFAGNLSGNATTATTAGTANSIPWTSVTSRPTAVSSFTNDSGYLTASNFAQSLSGNGYTTLPNGLKLVWATYSGLNSGDNGITWPSAFGTACLAAIANYSFSFATNSDGGIGVHSYSTSGATVRSAFASATVCVVAIGY